MSMFTSPSRHLEDIAHYFEHDRVFLSIDREKVSDTFQGYSVFRLSLLRLPDIRVVRAPFVAETSLMSSTVSAQSLKSNAPRIWKLLCTASYAAGASGISVTEMHLYWLSDKPASGRVYVDTTPARAITSSSASGTLVSAPRWIHEFD